MPLFNLDNVGFWNAAGHCVNSIDLGSITYRGRFVTSYGSSFYLCFLVAPSTWWKYEIIFVFVEGLCNWEVFGLTQHMIEYLYPFSLWKTGKALYHGLRRSSVYYGNVKLLFPVCMENRNFHTYRTFCLVYFFSQGNFTLLLYFWLQQVNSVILFDKSSIFFFVLEVTYDIYSRILSTKEILLCFYRTYYLWHHILKMKILLGSDW